MKLVTTELSISKINESTVILDNIVSFIQTEIAPLYEKYDNVTKYAEWKDETAGYYRYAMQVDEYENLLLCISKIASSNNTLYFELVKKESLEVYNSYLARIQIQNITYSTSTGGAMTLNGFLRIGEENGLMKLAFTIAAANNSTSVGFILFDKDSFNNNIYCYWTTGTTYTVYFDENTNVAGSLVDLNLTNNLDGQVLTHTPVIIQNGVLKSLLTNAMCIHNAGLSSGQFKIITIDNQRYRQLASTLWYLEKES